MYIRIFGLLFFYFLVSTLFAQKLVDDTQNLEILVFENVEKQQIRFIKSGAKIKFKLYTLVGYEPKRKSLAGF
jgi:hypothetical protein